MSLSISTSHLPVDNLKKTGVLIVPIFSATDLQGIFPKDLAATFNAAAKDLKWGSVELMLAPAGVAADFVALVGLGKTDLDIDKRMEGLRRGVGRVMQDVRRHKVREAVLVLSHLEKNVPELAQAGIEAMGLANYRFGEYSTQIAKDQAARSLLGVTLVVPQPVEREVKAVVVSTKRLLDGIELVRDLVNQPASHTSPAVLVAEAKKIAKLSPLLSVKVLDKKQAEKQGWGAFLAVARGSIHEPYVIHLQYKPKKKSIKKIVLIGKGITFDSGGLSLKPAQYMEDMKIDMAGAATVLGLFSLLPSLGLDIEVHGIVAACENMPSGNAYRPGDVLMAKNGKTIEVLNTDAEGRLTLADALSYAVEMKPDMIVDLATLTGAAMIAVGETHAALFSNDETVQASLLAAGKMAGEGLVALPLPEEYKAAIVSKVADLRNIGTTRYGDAILAALFLQEFVADVPWAHIDLAGPVHFANSPLPYWGSGASGYGVRTLVNFLKSKASAN